MFPRIGLAALLALAACAGATGSGGTTASVASSASGTSGATSSSSTGSTSGMPDASFTPAPHRPFPLIPYQTGPVMTSMTLVTITAENDPLAPQLQPFGDALQASNWWPTVGNDYNVGPVTSSLHLTGPAITSSLTNAAMITYVEALVADGGPSPDGERMYLLYLPADVYVIDAPPNACAYHEAYPDYVTTLGDSFGVVMHCDAPGAPQTLPDLTRYASHEVIEAATDPGDTGFTWGSTPPNPWEQTIWASIGGTGPAEVADACLGTQIIEDGGAGAFAYQRVWSNTAVGTGGDPCLPALDVPYYNVSIPQDWYVLDGGALEIPLTGWSTAPMGDWLVYIFPYQTTGVFQSLSNLIVTSPQGIESPHSCTYRAAGLNNGVAGSVTIPNLPSAHPGDFAVFAVQSTLVDESCLPLPGQDLGHLNFVGVYVPLLSLGDGGGACGVHNFDVTCPNAAGFCPLNSTCDPTYGCVCDPGYGTVTCGGKSCFLVDGGCEQPDWWCAPLGTPACGAENFAVLCPQGTYCPTSSTCGPGGSCDCTAGTQAVDCTDAPCTGNDCMFPYWWCH